MRFDRLRNPTSGFLSLSKGREPLTVEAVDRRITRCA